MAVPYTFGTATASIPLSQLDSNFATAITLGNTAIQLGNTVTTLNNMTLANVTISSGNITLTNVSATTANVTTANVVTMIVTGNETVQGNTSVTGTSTAAKFIPTGTSVTGNGMYLPATNSVGISTAGTNAVYIDASQNVGIGVVPSAWRSGAKALQLGNSGYASLNEQGNGSTSLNFNCYESAANTWTYFVTGVAPTRYTQLSGAHNWFNAPSGTAGNAITFTQAMTLDSSGNLGIGTSSPSTYVANGGLALAGAYGTSSTALAISNTTAYSASNIARFNFRLNNSFGGLEQVASITALNPNAAANNGGALTFATSANGTATTPTERMRIDNVGIVTMSYYGVGTATFSASGVISSVSDETWKIKDGIPVDPDSMLKKLEPGYWYYNEEKKEIFGVDRQLGFYAQNVNAALGPEAAPTPEEGKPWGYYDRSVLAVTVMSLKKALATIETLTARIEALETK
jgi:hypothetical protein